MLPEESPRGLRGGGRRGRGRGPWSSSSLFRSMADSSSSSSSSVPPFPPSMSGLSSSSGLSLSFRGGGWAEKERLGAASCARGAIGEERDAANENMEMFFFFSRFANNKNTVRLPSLSPSLSPYLSDSHSLFLSLFPDALKKTFKSRKEKKRSTPKCQMSLSQPPPPCSSSFPASRSNGDLRGLAAPSSPLPFHAAVAFAACAKEEDGRGALACETRGGGRAPPARAPPPPPPPPSRSPALSSPPPLPPLTPHTLSSITFSTSALQHLSLLFKDELGLCRGKGRRDLPRRCRRSERAVAAHRAGLAVLRFLSLFFFPLSPRA